MEEVGNARGADSAARGVSLSISHVSSGCHVGSGQPHNLISSEIDHSSCSETHDQTNHDTQPCEKVLTHSVGLEMPSLTCSELLGSKRAWKPQKIVLVLSPGHQVPENPESYSHAACGNTMPGRSDMVHILPAHWLGKILLRASRVPEFAPTKSFLACVLLKCVQNKPHDVD